MSLRGNKRKEFPLAVRKAAFARSCRDGVPHCENCGTFIRAGHLRYEHLQPDGLQGEPTLENCGVFCDVCARAKDKIDNPIMVKADRVTRKAYGLTRAPRQKIHSRGFAKAAPQRSASRPVQKFT
jgi:hypothetical protein